MTRIEIAIKVLVKFLIETVPNEELHPMVTDGDTVLATIRAAFILEEFKKLEGKEVEIPPEVQRDLQVVTHWFCN